MDQRQTTGGQAKGNVLASINSINMGDTVMNFLLNLSSKTDLSPKGFIAMLNFVHDMIALEQKPFMQKIFKVNILPKVT